MEITIKIDFNEENMTKLADIFWKAALTPVQKPDDDDKKVMKMKITTTETKADPASDTLMAKPLTPTTIERGQAYITAQVEKEDDFAHKYKHLEKPVQKPAKKPEPTKPIKEWSEFPEMLNQRVKDSPLSIAEIANKLRVSQACIYNWKRGSNIPCPPHLGRLCYLFNWDRDYMLKLREEAVTK